MHRRPQILVTLLLLAALGVSCTAPTPPGDRGGPARGWPPGGPTVLWERELGPGYSGIVVDGDRLYTMYRADDDEVVTCLDARSGEPRWEHRYESTAVAGQDTEYGEGPNAAPLLYGGRLYTIGFAGVLHALDAATGTVLWSSDLLRELGGDVIELGYSSSPVGYGETIIALVGGRGQGAVAFDRDSGRIVWKNLDFEVSFATPVIMRILGQDQLVVFAATEVVGADPTSGESFWRYPIRNHYPQNICAPIQVDDEMLFVSTGEAGSRGLRVVRDDGLRVEEVWSTSRLECFYGLFAMVGETIYGTSGFQSGPRMTAIRAKTGEIEWRRRGFNLSHIVSIDGTLVLLDDEGKLTLATPGSEGLEVHAEARVLSPPSLTPPTIEGTVLYARDQHRIIALDLGSPEPSSGHSP